MENPDKFLGKLEADLTRQLADARRLRASLQGGSFVKEKKKRRTTTIQQEALEILARYPDGLTMLEILDEMLAIYRPDLLRESLSPQLTLLKKAGKVVSGNKIWKLAPDLGMGNGKK